MPIKIEGDGNQERCFTYVTDVVNSNILAAVSETVFGQNFNIAAENNTTIKDLATIIMNMEKDATIIKAPPRIGDIRRFNPDITKAKKYLEYIPQIDFREGLINTYKFFKGR